ncbi:programmed cell death protein 6-like [Hyalella azteca]|uniref:Programmed cell death protein 6-like n=1 Tax=Hyalella azteca TaxID=294128 RepID=A0A8B7PH83_HYAAZ|nr:programmed cell death protein 6-like [Hyalella azteca]
MQKKYFDINMAGNPYKNYLLSVFQNVDQDRSGTIDAQELQTALSNGHFTPFNLDTVRLLIGMFDKANRNVIMFEDFIHLWKFLLDCHHAFLSFDQDNSNNINKEELKTCLTTAFGYSFSEPFIDVLVQKFDRTGEGVIYFDDFIQCCIELQDGICANCSQFKLKNRFLLAFEL